MTSRKSGGGHRLSAGTSATALLSASGSASSSTSAYALNWFVLTVTWRLCAPSAHLASCTVPRGMYSRSPGSSSTSSVGSGAISPREKFREEYRGRASRSSRGGYTRHRLRPSS